MTHIFSRNKMFRIKFITFPSTHSFFVENIWKAYRIMKADKNNKVTICDSALFVDWEPCTKISWKLTVCILEAKKSIADSGCTLCVAKFANETDTTLSKIPYVVSIGNFTPNLNFQTRHGSNIQVVELHRLLVDVLTLCYEIHLSLRPVLINSAIIPL